jgi:hypothetical protein
MVLQITLVTDDLDLCALAAEFTHETMTALELLKLMLNEGRIRMDEVQATIVMWDYLEDYPSDFFTEFKRLFSVDPERLR